MSDRPTPLTDEAEYHSGPDTATALEGMVDADFARDLERKLAEANEQLAGYEKRLDSSQRARRSLSDAADHLNKRLREDQAKLAEAREALESVRSDCQCAIDQYNANGPQWTSRESGAEYYDASYVVESAHERIATIDEALARIDENAGREALPPSGPKPENG